MSSTEAKVPMRHRIRAWMDCRAVSPMAAFIAERVYAAPGNRLAIAVLVRAYRRHCETLGINPGANSELISAVRAKFPDARRLRARSGIDVHRGDHLSGLALR